MFIIQRICCNDNWNVDGTDEQISIIGFTLFLTNFAKASYSRKHDKHDTLSNPS